MPGTFHKTEYSLLYELTLAQRGVAFEWLKTKSFKEMIKYKYESNIDICINDRVLSQNERNIFLGFVIATKATYFEFNRLSKTHLLFIAEQLKEALVKAFNTEFSIIMKRLEINNHKVYEELQKLFNEVKTNDGEFC